MSLDTQALDFSSKVLLRKEVCARAQKLKSEGKKIGFTSGSFDLLHLGHVNYLTEAKRVCDVLIVGVNSDQSVKKYKDPSRPINLETDRASVIAALACVDLVFIFDELNNNENISLLKPDLYIKAGDYTKEKLSSAALVESYGGKVKIIPFVEGRSTSGLIDKIKTLHSDAVTSSIELIKSKPRPTVFFDRDGTLVEHVEYLSEPSKVKLLPGVIEGLRALQAKGYALVVVTNQPGIGLGYFSKEDFFAVNREFLTQVSTQGIRIDKIYYCPHSVADRCECRKPGIKLIERAVQEVPADLSRSFMVGDMSSDIECGKRAGLTTILVHSGRAGKDGLFKVTPDISTDSFANISTLIEKD